jgi:hypothetical protein
MDSIVIIASYDNNIIHTETYNTPVPDLTAMITIESNWSIVCLSMDYIVIIAVRSGTGVLYVSVWILLLS